MRFRPLMAIGMLLVTSGAFAQGVQKPPVTPGDTQKLKPGPKAVVRVVPVTGTGSRPSDYCRLGPNGLVVRLENIGDLQAPPNRVTVTFRTSAGSVSRTRTSAVIPPAETVDVIFPIPEGCPSPDCGFTIKRPPWPAIAGFCVG
jgi:hypothetical protein